MTSLVDQLSAALGASIPDTDVAELEATLTAAWASGREAWPDVVVDPRAFVIHMAERVDRQGDLLSALRALCASDLYLACACEGGAPAAIGAFERDYLGPIDRVLERMGMSTTTIDEVKQRLRIRLLVAEGDKRPRIASYAGRGDLKRWVRAAAVRLALTLQRDGGAAKMTDDAVLETLADARQDLELDLLKRIYGAAFGAAIREAFATLAPRDRNLLRYYFEKNLSIDQIGVIYHVHRSTAARRIRNANEELVAKTRECLAAHLKIESNAVSSILRLVQSQYELALRSVLVP